MRVTTLYLLGSSGFGVLGIGVPFPVCHSAWSFEPFQKALMWLYTCDRFAWFMAFIASAGTPFAPGDLSFFIPFTAVMNSFHVMGSSSCSYVSRCTMKLSASGETMRWLLNTRRQCGWKMLMFSLSVFARCPFGSRSDMVFCFL